MPRPRNSVPSYRLHRQSGQARVSLPLADGRRRDILLGPYNSPESKAEYARVIAEWQSAVGRAIAPHGGPDGSTPATANVTIDEMLDLFFEHADQHYRDVAGKPTSEISVYTRAIGELRHLYGHRPAASFGPLALKAVRERMVGNDVSRKVINVFVGKIRAVFRWAASEQLVSPAIAQGLATVAGLQRGRTTARETEPVKPIADAFVEATIRRLNPTVRGMVELQRLTGMRPSEICQIRACDLDVAGEVWLYRPATHKTAWRGRDRVIAIGPQAQRVIKQFLTANLAAPLFSPRRERDERHARLRANATSPSRRQRFGKKYGTPASRPAREHYDRNSYARAVARAVEAANKATHAEAKSAGRLVAAHELIPHWHPNQLRHSHATKVRRRFGLEAAQVSLGHAKADVTQIYAVANVAEAVRVAREIG